MLGSDKDLSIRERGRAVARLAKVVCREHLEGGIGFHDEGDALLVHRVDPISNEHRRSPERSAVFVGADPDFRDFLTGFEIDAFAVFRDCLRSLSFLSIWYAAGATHNAHRIQVLSAA